MFAIDTESSFIYLTKQNISFLTTLALQLLLYSSASVKQNSLQRISLSLLSLMFLLQLQSNFCHPFLWCCSPRLQKIYIRFNTKANSPSSFYMAQQQHQHQLLLKITFFFFKRKRIKNILLHRTVVSIVDMQVSPGENLKTFENCHSIVVKSMDSRVQIGHVGVPTVITLYLRANYLTFLDLLKRHHENKVSDT